MGRDVAGLKDRGTYAYCVVADRARPRSRRARAGLPGTGPVRLLDVERGLYLAVADAPLDRYGADAINRGLGDLDWVSRAAVAHERVVESFVDASAVLPMKLFTIFTSDERAVAHVRAERQRITAAARRVAKHHEWGVRVVFDRARAAAAAIEAAPSASRDTEPSSGAAYLTRKKAQRDAGVERASRARETVAALYDRLAARATLARRKAPRELPVQGGPLLLDAAFLVARRRAGSFRSLVSREAAALARQGYGVTLTGPWPPYSFVGE
jgi:gas vesicle protein GvpL/GvpF